MTQSTMLDDKSLMRILLGAAIGGVITIFVGFSGFGWTFESTARNRANTAVIEVLAPICAENFQHAADASKNKLALMKVSSSDQASFIEQGGWAKFPGNSSSNNAAVADACVKIISEPK